MKSGVLITIVTVFLLLVFGRAGAEFVAEDYISGQSFITTVAFSPNGQMYFIEKNTGLIKVILRQNLVRSQPFFALDVNSAGERGGLGLTFHPDYPDSPYVYCYATIPEPILANVVIRIIDSLGFGVGPDTIFRAPITVGASNHNGGNIRFGPDGKLYITIGENNQPSWAQDTCRVQGKIIRINYDGSIPSDNPIGCAPVFAYGLRNSYDFCFHPATGVMYASENGPSSDDELNRILPGRNYGWPVVQCFSTEPAYTNPIFCWPQIIAPTGIVVAWNSHIDEFNGKLLMTDWNTGTLRALTLNVGGDSIISEEEVYSTGFGLVDVDQGPDGCFYLTSHDGRIVRLRPAIDLPNPFALVSPDDDDRTACRNTTFAWRKSTDPDGPIDYRLEISTGPTFNPPIFSIVTGGVSLVNYPTDTLFAHARKFYWRAVAIDIDGNTTIGGLPMPEWRRINVIQAGDANADGMLNGLDILFIRNYLQGSNLLPNPAAASDVNNDCQINGSDLLYLSNFFKGGPAPLRSICHHFGLPGD